MANGHPQFTKAFVAGGFLPVEFASSDDRRFFVHHWLSRERWDASVRLSRALTHALSRNLNLGLQTGVDQEGWIPIEPGIFARNLGLNRRVVGAPLSYVECLYYNDRSEFDRLWDRTHPLEIAGQTTYYSDRIAEIAGALFEGASQFVFSN